VRTLAQRSASAAKEIKTLIGASVEQVDAGGRLVDDAGRKMAGIVSSVDGVTGIVNAIGSASHEESIGIEGVSRTICELESAIRAHGNLVKDVVVTANGMTEQAVGLMRLVSTFNLGTREQGNADEAIALVKAGVEYAKAHGRNALIDDIMRLGKGRFVDRDLYLMVIDFDAKFVAHGNNARVIGQGPASKDTDGKFFIVDLVQMARATGAGWTEYKWAHPLTNEIGVKQSYFEKCGDVVVACGIYKA